MSHSYWKLFFITKKTINKQTGFVRNFLQAPIQVCWGDSIHYFNTPFFCCSLFYENISTHKLEWTIIGKQIWLLPVPFKISLKVTFIHIYIYLLGLYLSPECLLNFLSNLKIFFIFMVLTILENALNLGIFTHAPFPTQNSSPGSYRDTPGRRKLLIPLGSIFSKICFPQQ